MSSLTNQARFNSSPDKLPASCSDALALSAQQASLGYRTSVFKVLHALSRRGDFGEGRA
jgi:hypothetical protein